MRTERLEQLLTTIDRLGAVKIKHLLAIHNDLRSYRNACRVVRELEPFTNQIFYDREKVIYLNKEGRQLIGSTKEVKKSPVLEHTLLRNEVYLYFGCPIDWRTEHTIEKPQERYSSLQIKVEGVKLKQKKVVADAVFTRNADTYLIEVDNTRNMSDNRKKIELYKEVMPSVQAPILYFFTVSEIRKRKLEQWLKGVRAKVKTFGEVT